MTGNCHVRFGGGRLEKCQRASIGNSLAAYPTPTLLTLFSNPKVSTSFVSPISLPMPMPSLKDLSEPFEELQDNTPQSKNPFPLSQRP